MPPEQTHAADAGGVPAQVADVVDVDDPPAGAPELEDCGEDGDALALDAPVVAEGAEGVVAAAVVSDGSTHKPPWHTKPSLG
jgi:hypothetical protein